MFPQTADTTTAAKAMGRHVVTLRKWVKTDTSPVRVVKVHGRLRWYVDDIQRVLEGGSK